MKKIFILLATLIFVFVANAQEIVPLEKIVENNIPKSKIFVNAINWCTKNNVDLKKDIELKNEETGGIVCNTYSFLQKTNNSKTNYLSFSSKFNLKIDCRDKKYRLVLINPIVKVTPSDVDMSSMSTKSLFLYQDELKAVLRISQEYFNELIEWDYQKVISIHQEKKLFVDETNRKIAELQTDKKNKKEIKKLEYELEKFGLEVNVLSEIIQRMSTMIDYIYSDFDKSINTNDDF